MNLESAAFMQWHGDATTITFAVARAEAPIVLLVKETPEEISHDAAASLEIAYESGPPSHAARPRSHSGEERSTGDDAVKAPPHPRCETG